MDHRTKLLVATRRCLRDIKKKHPAQFSLVTAKSAMNRLPSDLIHYIWSQYLADLVHLFAIRSVNTHFLTALEKPYKKVVRYRLLLNDPRCLDYQTSRMLLRQCKFPLLKQIEGTFLKKLYIPKHTFYTLLAMTRSMRGVANVFALQIDDASILCFSHHTARDGQYHIRCMQWPNLVMVLDSEGGLFPTATIDLIHSLLWKILRSPLKSLMHISKTRQRCNLCNEKIGDKTSLMPCHKMNPGLGDKCFMKYRLELRKIQKKCYGDAA